MFRGDRLKTLRKEKGLTQTDLAEMLGISKSAICFYEKSKRNPSIENIIDFMHIFGVTSDYLIGTDKIIKTVSKETVEYITMSNEELVFIEELKKNKTIYNTLLANPKRGVEIIKTKIG